MTNEDGSADNKVSEYEDTDLMFRIASGDAGAYAQLVERHLGRTVRLALRIMGSKADAEDVAQDAFIKVWKNAKNWKSPGQGGAKFTTWFHRVVVNQAIDHKRRQRSVSIDDGPELASADDDALVSMQKDEDAAQVAKAVERLPERQRVALTLCFYEGHSNAQAAQIMGISVKAVESLLVRARQALRGELSKLGVERGMKKA